MCSIAFYISIVLVFDICSFLMPHPQLPVCFCFKRPLHVQAICANKFAQIACTCIGLFTIIPFYIFYQAWTYFLSEFTHIFLQIFFSEYTENDFDLFPLMFNFRTYLNCLQWSIKRTKALSYLQ